MKKEIGKAIGLLAFFTLLLAPIDPALIPIEARYVLAVTVLMAIFWVTEAIPLEVTALLPIVLFPFLGVLTVREATTPYADPVIFLFMGGFIIAMSMQRWGLHRRIALHIINIVGTSPRRLILGFMVATAFLSMWISNTATAMMMIPIAIAIIATVMPGINTKLNEMNEEQRDFAGCLVIAVAYAANIGGIGTIIGSPPNGIFIAQMKILFPEAPEIDFFTWMKFGIPLAAMLTPIVWLWLIKVPYRHLPRRLSQAKEVIKQEMEELGPMSRGEQWTLFVFLLAAFSWIFAKTKDIGGVTVPGLDIIIPGISDTGIAIFAAILLFVLPVNWKEGIFTMNWEWAEKIPWGILILFGGGLCLSAAFIKSGLATLIVDSFSMLYLLPIVVIALIVALVVSLLTEVSSNTAIASVMMPIMAVTSVSMGLHPYVLMMTAAVCASLAFMLPVATPPNAVAFGTGYIDIRTLVRSGWALNLIGVFFWTIFLFTVVMWAVGFTADPPGWALNP